MGRSEGSRNRVFVLENGVVRTVLADPSKAKPGGDLSLIIYNAMMETPDDPDWLKHHIVSNGRQTDAVAELLPRNFPLEYALVNLSMNLMPPTSRHGLPRLPHGCLDWMEQGQCFTTFHFLSCVNHPGLKSLIPITPTSTTSQRAMAIVSRRMLVTVIRYLSSLGIRFLCHSRVTLKILRSCIGAHSIWKTRLHSWSSSFLEKASPRSISSTSTTRFLRRNLALCAHQPRQFIDGRFFITNQFFLSYVLLGTRSSY